MERTLSAKLQGIVGANGGAPYDEEDIKKLKNTELWQLVRHHLTHGDGPYGYRPKDKKTELVKWLSGTMDGEPHQSWEDATPPPPRANPTPQDADPDTALDDADNEVVETEQEGNSNEGHNEPPKPKAEQPTEALSEYLGQMANDAVLKAIQRNQEEIQRPVFHISLPDSDEEVVVDEAVHNKFSEVLFEASLGLPVLMVGPSGTGKTHLARQVAKAMQLPYTFNSMSEGVSESHLLGRTLPDETGNWSYHPSDFVKAYRDGGVHLLDELDAADSNLMVHVNSALSNGHLAVPYLEKPIEKHKNCVILACANTFGTGADRQYSGRNPLDDATMDRFSLSKVEVDYDTALERKIVNGYLDGRVADKLLNWAWTVRENIKKNSLRRIMSTRTIAVAAQQIKAGRPFEKVVDKYFTGWSDSERQRAAEPGK